MKPVIKCLVSVLLAATLLLPSSVNSVSARTQSDSLYDMALDLIDFQVDSGKFESREEWLEKGLAKNIENGGEWYIIALSQLDGFDLFFTEEHIENYLSENKIHSRVTRQKYALCLSSVGSTSSYISSVLDEISASDGIMSLVFGLHLLNNRYESKGCSVNDLKSAILSRVGEDGGWSLTGASISDVDVTAMTLQALSPYVNDDKAVSEAVSSALRFLSESQLDSGGFKSYGQENAESSAQVLIALSSLGIDFQTDTRFIKNGNTVLNALEGFRLPSGGFAHISDMKFSAGATAQALCALVSCVRFYEERSPLYIFDNARPEDVESAPKNDIGGDNDSLDKEEKDQRTEKKSGGYKIWASLSVVAIGMLAAVLIWILKRRNIKNFIAIAVLTLIALLVIFFTDIQSPDSYYGGQLPEKDDPIGSVTVSVRCEKVSGRSDDIPSDGVIIKETKIDIEKGESVYDILVQVAKYYSVPLDSDIGPSSAYVVGIGDLYQFDFGDLSGWVCLVNGKEISVGASEYKLKDKDVVEWHYTLNLGKDIKEK